MVCPALRRVGCGWRRAGNGYYRSEIPSRSGRSQETSGCSRLRPAKPAASPNRSKNDIPVEVTGRLPAGLGHAEEPSTSGTRPAGRDRAGSRGHRFVEPRCTPQGIGVAPRPNNQRSRWRFRFNAATSPDWSSALGWKEPTRGDCHRSRFRTGLGSATRVESADVIALRHATTFLFKAASWTSRSACKGGEGSGAGWPSPLRSAGRGKSGRAVPVTVRRAVRWGRDV